MSYLQLPGGIPNFSKAVFSFWCGVPSESIAAAQAQWTGSGVDAGIDEGGTQNSNLPGMIPLVTFGPNPTATTSSSVFSASSQTSPCFIGINCGPQILEGTPNTPSPPSLVAHFVYANQSRDFTLNPGAINESNSHLPKYIDIGYDVGSVTFFRSAFAVPDPPPAILVAADQWHHILVSFDLSSGCFPGKFYLAFDDVNYNGNYLFPSGGPSPAAYGAGSDPNNIITSLFSAATGGTLETAAHPFGIPCTSENTSRVYKVQMAEFQLFTGVTLVTGVTQNRRAFIKADGTPERSSVAQALLGKAPTVLLHGSDNWKIGRNTGSVGDFTRTGIINPFATAPRLTL